ncbi:MAG: hypothetical protein HY547_08890 [Elusimicrobia bacterium]|nr:hypothetical protein [Elusimicrobiota bacterium]
MNHCKRGLGACLAMLIAGGNAGALDLDLTKIKLDGMIMMKGQGAKNETDLTNTANDGRHIGRTAFILGVGGPLADGVSARVEAVRKPLGDVTATTTAGQFGQARQSVLGELGNVAIENAYLDLEDVLWEIDAKVGRQYLGSDSDFVAYAGRYDDDTMTVFGVDAVNLMRKVGLVDISYYKAVTRDVKATWISTDYTPAVSRWTVQKLGAVTNVKDWTGNDDWNVPVSLAYHHGNNLGTAAPTDNTNLGVLSLNAGASLMEDMLKLNFDWASNSGQRHTGAGTMLDFKGSLMALQGMVNLEDWGLGVALEYANASGDDGSSATEDKSFHDMSAFGMVPRRSYGQILGQSNTLGGGTPLLQGLDSGSALTGAGRGFNVLALCVHYTLPGMEKLALDYDWFSAAANKLAASATTDKKIGTEMDLTLSWAKSETLSFDIGMARFTPQINSAVLGALLGGGSGNAFNDNVEKLFANASLKF